MTKSIFKVGVLARNLPIALCYLFASAVFAQNAEEIRAIQGKTDLKALSQLSSRIQKEEIITKIGRASCRERV